MEQHQHTQEKITMEKEGFSSERDMKQPQQTQEKITMGEEGFSSEWLERVEAALNNNTLMKNDSSRRVPEAMLRLRSEAYIPQFVSLGLYEHERFKYHTICDQFTPLPDLSAMEVKKANSAIALSKEHPGVFSALLKTIRENRSDVEEYYNERFDDKERYKIVVMKLAVDACFILQFLLGRNSQQQEREGTDISTMQQEKREGTDSSTMQKEKRKETDFSTMEGAIKCDLIKLDNQVPFWVLKNTFLEFKNSFDPDAGRRPFKCEKLFLNAYKNLSPFPAELSPSEDVLSIPLDLLSYMHGLVSKYLTIKEWESPPTFKEKIKRPFERIISGAASFFIEHPANRGHMDFVHKYTASELKKAGIKFRSFSAADKRISFKPHSSTMYLPRIIVTQHYTEVFLRNLLALEFNEEESEKTVTRYAVLMDCLIDTPDDAKILREAHVITRSSVMMTDEHICEMWDGIKPFFSGFEGLSKDLMGPMKEVLIRNYYKSRLKSWWFAFREQNLSSPWAVVAMITAILVLFMQVVATYCLFQECVKK